MSIQESDNDNIVSLKPTLDNILEGWKTEQPAGAEVKAFIARMAKEFADPIDRAEWKKRIAAASGFTRDEVQSKIDAVDRTAAEQTVKGKHQIKQKFVDDEVIVRLKAMNKRHALVAFQGKQKYLDVIGNADAYEPPYQFLEPALFAAIYKAEPDVKFSEYQGSNLVPGYANVNSIWGEWPKRRGYMRVGFFPGAAKCPDEVFNLWEGWRIKPKKGKWKRMLRHIYSPQRRRPAFPRQYR